MSDAKLGGLIKAKLDIKCVYDATILELMRGIRGQLESLVTGLSSAEAASMQLGLSHPLCRYKLKFSPDKVDVLLDELDKELNTYAMRVREWYGWHSQKWERSSMTTSRMQRSALFSHICRAQHPHSSSYCRAALPVNRSVAMCTEEEQHRLFRRSPALLATVPRGALRQESALRDSV